MSTALQRTGLPRDTLISQFANSPTIVQLINDMDAYVNPSADVDAFYGFVWDVSTAQGFGLDIWGKIVGVSRDLTIPGDLTYLGYQEATSWQPFGHAPLYSGVLPTQTYTLSDDAYRTLIFVKALTNISDCTSPNLNRMLQTMFAERGRCYVSDTGSMEMRFVFEFALEPFELAIMTQSGVMPNPAGVLVNILQTDLPTTFGFSEGDGQPFGYGVFFNSSGLTYAGV